MKNSKLILAVVLSLSYTLSYAQFDPDQGCIVDVNGQCVPNTISTAVPFLGITPDARASGMGNVGLATSTDPNSMFHNSSKLAFSTHEVGVSATYSPWLQQLGLTDVFLINLAAFKQINKIQTFGFDLRYFSLGDISFTDFNGNPLGQGKPREVALTFGYARKLSSNFSAGINVKYINSNLASGLTAGGRDISSGNSFAGDISFTYKKEIKNNELTIGTSITNLGAGITYTNSTQRDRLPSNFGLGTTYKLNLDEYNSISLSFDLNKLLVPTPIAPRIVSGSPEGSINPEYDQDNNGIADFREKGTFSGIVGSFGDAQGGLSEEIKEIQYAIGLEYWYDKQFAVRTGYFHESFLKGDRKFLTVGIGINYNVFGIDLSYLVPTNNRRNPLDNTLRFSLNFNLDQNNN